MSFSRKVRAFWVGYIYTAKEHPIFVFGGTAIAALFIYALVASWFEPPPTPAEIQAQRAAEATAAAQQAQAAEHTKYLCHMKYVVCPDYAKARQDCATAGSYERCLNIKMGSEYWLRSGCLDDGTVAAPTDTIPDFGDCIAQRVQNWLH